MTEPAHTYGPGCYELSQAERVVVERAGALTAALSIPSHQRKREALAAFYRDELGQYPGDSQTADLAQLSQYVTGTAAVLLPQLMAIIGRLEHRP
jgi:hypothetical protein